MAEIFSCVKTRAVKYTIFFNLLFLWYYACLNSHVLCEGMGTLIGSHEESKEIEQSCVLHAKSALPLRRQDSLCDQAKWRPSASDQVREHCFCIWNPPSKGCLKDSNNPLILQAFFLITNIHDHEVMKLSHAKMFPEQYVKSGMKLYSLPINRGIFSCHLYSNRWLHNRKWNVDISFLRASAY